MSGTTVGTAYVQIVPSTQGITGSITSALSGEANSAGKSAGESLGNNIVSSITTIVAGSAAVIGAAVGSIIAGATSTAEYGDTIDKTSQKLQVTASEYQALDYAAQHCGFSTSTFMTAQKKLASTDFSGSIVDALNSVMELGTAEERTAAASELFGERATQQMQPLLNGEKTINDYMGSLEALGGLMSDDAVKASATFEDSLTDMQTAFSGLKNSMMSDFLPSMSTVMNGISMLVAGEDGGIEAINVGIKGFMKTAISILPQAIEVFGSIISSIGSAILDNLPMIVEMGTELIVNLIVGIASALPQIIASIPQIIEAIKTGFENANVDIVQIGIDLITSLVDAVLTALPQLIPMGVEIILGINNAIIGAIPQIIEVIPTLITTLVDSLVENLPLLVEGSIQLFVGIGMGLIQATPQIVAQIPAIISAIISGLAKTIPQFITQGGNFIKGISQGAKNMLGTAKSTAQTIGSNMVTAVKQGLGSLVTVGIQWMQGLVNGITNAASWVADKIRSVCSNALEAVKSFFGIHSPSTVMAEMGAYMMQGLANGITDSTGLVEKAMTTMSADTLNSSLNINGSVASGMGRNSDLAGILGTLNAINSKSGVTVLKLNNRELGRALREEGVAFA